MSWECKYLRETFCDKRKKECCPGAVGCVLYGKFAFPLRNDAEEKPSKPGKTRNLASKTPNLHSKDEKSRL